jgi:DNA polymerase-3 subunit beta
MKFSIEQSSLLEVLQKIQGPTSLKQNFPILNCILTESLEDKIKFTTTDLDITVIFYTTGEVFEKGKIAIPAKNFIPIIRELPKKKVTIEIIKNNLLIRCEKVEFKIKCMDPQEFPQVEEEKETSLIRINTQDLLEMIKMTSFCVGFEDTSYVLNGILFEIFDDKINLVSTDGKRLSFIERKLPSTQPEITKKIKFILPFKGINELYKLIKDTKEEIYIFTKKNSIGFDLKQALFICRPIEGEFPNYSQYIPKPTQSKLIINRRNFLAALKRAQLLSAPDYQGVKIDLKKNEVNIYKSTPHLGEVRESIEADYTGQNLQIGFNASYLIDVLKNLEEAEVVFEIYDVDKPAVLRLQDYIYLVLPMKI